MPLDPILASLAEGMANAPDARPTHELTPAQAREGYLTIPTMFGPGEEVAKVEDRVIEGPAGDIPLRVYTPQGTGPFGVLVFYHGGGFVIGDLDTHDRECRELCNGAGCVVVAVHYRLAPEQSFPAAPVDAYAALQWVGEHAGEIGGDADRIAVGGDSAGGNLAAVVSLLARDGDGPPLRFQLLVYPAVDLRTDADFPSLTDNAQGPFLLKATMDYFMDHYFGAGDTDAARRDVRASPLLADSHAGLPPALIITAEFDPLRDEGAAYAKALQDADVPVKLHMYEGMAHLFFQLSPMLPQGKALLEECAAAVCEAIG